MLPTAEEQILAPRGEEIFSLAALFAASFEPRIGENAARGEKPHQGIFSKNRAVRIGKIWPKWSGTHQDRKCSWSKTVLGIAIDANGNTLSDPSGKQYTWDFENRLTQVINPGVGTTTFRYDPFGRRIQKSGPLGTTNYLYDGKNLLEEADQSGNVLVRYTQTEKIDEQLAELRSGGTNYYEADGLGSVTSLSSSAGGVANTYTFDSFGQLTAHSGTLVNPFQYTGREFDPETGLNYNRARYYNPTSGRFISEDPIKFKGGINFYAYVHNDPADLIDALGLCDKNCRLFITCGPTPRTHGFAHCTVTIQNGSSYTAYDGGPSGSIWWSQLIVGQGPGAPPTNPVVNAPVPCDCAQQEANAINSGSFFYSFPLQNSNTAAWMLAANCGLNPSF